MLPSARNAAVLALHCFPLIPGCCGHCFLTTSTPHHTRGKTSSQGSSPGPISPDEMTAMKGTPRTLGRLWGLLTKGGFKEKKTYYCPGIKRGKKKEKKERKKREIVPFYCVYCYLFPMMEHTCDLLSIAMSHRQVSPHPNAVMAVEGMERAKKGWR